MVSSLIKRIFAGIVVFLCVAWAFRVDASPLSGVHVPRILVLNSYNLGYDWWEDEMAGLRPVLAGAFPRVELFIEHLDTKKFPSKHHFPAEAELLEIKYRQQRPDILIAMDNAALEFALRYRQRLAPDTPLIFCGVNDFKPSMVAGQPRITGVAENHDSLGTLDGALQLHPTTRTIIAIHDYTDTGLAIRRELEATAGRHPAVKLQFMEEMPLEETVKKLRGIPSDTLVLMLSYTVEKGGRTFSHSEAAELVSKASPVPVYSVYAAQLGHGVVGGRMMKGQIQGQKAGELAVRVLNGEAAETLPIITDHLSQPMFDYHQLKRFGIDFSRLPSDAELINRPSSTFAVNKTALCIGLLFSLLCTVGLIGMTLNIRKRRRLEEQLRHQIDQYQESQEELQATEEMLRAQVDEYMLSQEELHSTEEMLRVQLTLARESSQKFRAVFEHSPITVAVTDLPDGTFSEVNQAFVDMFGYSREEALGRTTLELGVWLHESDRTRYLALLKEQGYVHNFETEMRRKDGVILTVLFSGALMDVAGKPCVLSAVMEISEQKRLQTQLYQSQKMDVVGQLAGGIAHDFNNMLAGIMAASELIKRRLPEDDKNHRLVDTIIEATLRSADLTRQLLTFARKGTAVTSPVRIHETISAVISLLERTIDKQIVLSTRLNAGNPVVLGDQAQLQNALLNLGVNARDAMPKGGTLTYATATRNLSEAACNSLGISHPAGRFLEIMVSDTGIGMPKDVLEHIFEPFFTTKEVGKGTGLGLATVYGAVKSHGGCISVRSQPETGTIFTIFLPLADEEYGMQPICDQLITGSGGVLLVDDEELLRELGRDLLESCGYEVYLAEDGIRALEVVAAHRSRINLVILDMIMPKMGGRETFLKLRELYPDLKVLFCSGYSHEGTGEELVGLGAKGFIQKPYSSLELSRSVAEALN